MSWKESRFLSFVKLPYQSSTAYIIQEYTFTLCLSNCYLGFLGAGLGVGWVLAHAAELSILPDYILGKWLVVGAPLVAQMVKNALAMQETQVPSLGRKDPLEKEIATHSSILAWRIPWTEEPGGPQSMGSQRARHDWATNIGGAQHTGKCFEYSKLGLKQSTKPHSLDMGS